MEGVLCGGGKRDRKGEETVGETKQGAERGDGGHKA